MPDKRKHYYIVKSIREVIHVDLVAIVDEAGVKCSICYREFEKGDKVVVFEEQESSQVAHMDHLEIEIEAK